MTTKLTVSLPNNNLRGVIIANYATAAALPAYTYANGTLGVGATITYNATGVAAAVDGQTVALNDVMQMNHGTDHAHDGPYKCTTLGAVGVAQVWTRVTAADTAAKLAGCQVAVLLGTLNNNTGWVLPKTAASITVGTTALTFANQRAAAHMLFQYLSTAAAGVSSVRYMNTSTLGYSTTEADSVYVVGSNCTITAMYVIHGTGIVDTITYTVRLDGADTAVTCQMAGSGTATNVTGQAVTATAGQKLTLSSQQSSTTAAANLRARVTIVATVP